MLINTVLPTTELIVYHKTKSINSYIKRSDLLSWWSVWLPKNSISQSSMRLKRGKGKLSCPLCFACWKFLTNYGNKSVCGLFWMLVTCSRKRAESSLCDSESLFDRNPALDCCGGLNNVDYSQVSSSHCRSCSSTSLITTLQHTAR